MKITYSESAAVESPELLVWVETVGIAGIQSYRGVYITSYPSH